MLLLLPRHRHAGIVQPSISWSSWDDQPHHNRLCYSVAIC
jgi:hypothetical protein